MLRTLLILSLASSLCGCAADRWDSVCDGTRAIASCAYTRDYRKDGVYLCPVNWTQCSTMQLTYRTTDAMDKDPITRTYRSTGECVFVGSNVGESLLLDNGCKAYGSK